MKAFSGRVAVITGAAGGLGRELANAAAGLGMRLVLADVDAAALELVTGELRAGGTQVLSMVCDVGKGAHVRELADAALARFHAVHLLFNNAGAAAAGLVWQNRAADWERVLGENLWGVIHGVRVFTPLMLDCARRDPAYEGHIVNTASMAALLAPPALGVVSVSSHAVLALSETLYHDLRLVHAPIQASVLCQELVAAGTLQAHEVARITFDAIREGRFYIYPQPQGLAAVAERMDALLHAALPADPYAAAPDIEAALRAGLRRS